MTDLEISQLISYTQMLWPHSREVDRGEQIVAWREQLADVDADAGRAAVDEQSAAGREFAPPPGLIRRRALVLAAGPGAPSPEQAWAEVLETIRVHPHQQTTQDACWRSRGRVCPDDCEHRTVSFSHPALQAAVEGLGYRALCESCEPMADRAHFMRLYAASVDRLERDLAVPPTVAALAAARPAGELGPRSGGVRALPSDVVDDERDNDAGIANVNAVREAIAAAVKRVDADG